MKPHPKLRKTIKWGGAAVTVLLVVVWIGSGWCFVTWRIAGTCAIGVDTGRVVVLRDIQPAAGIAMAGGPTLRAVVLSDGWTVEPHPFYLQWGFELGQNGILWWRLLPLWGVIVAMLFVSGCAWRLDTLARRRARVGRCPKCNYDRAGIAKNAVCPECGAGAA